MIKKHEEQVVTFSYGGKNYVVRTKALEGVALVKVTRDRVVQLIFSPSDERVIVATAVREWGIPRAYEALNQKIV